MTSRRWYNQVLDREVQIMTTFTADPQLRDLFGRFREVTEVRDSTGKLIGTFTPAAYTENEPYTRAAAHFDPEELKRRKESNQVGKTTAEVLELLKSLGSQG
jgi:hypothetical protein